jgi:hypothetical protein
MLDEESHFHMLYRGCSDGTTGSMSGENKASKLGLVVVDHPRAIMHPKAGVTRAIWCVRGGVDLDGVARHHILFDSARALLTLVLIALF